MMNNYRILCCGSIVRLAHAIATRKYSRVTLPMLLYVLCLPSYAFAIELAVGEIQLISREKEIRMVTFPGDDARERSQLVCDVKQFAPTTIAVEAISEGRCSLTLWMTDGTTEVVSVTVVPPSSIKARRTEHFTSLKTQIKGQYPSVDFDYDYETNRLVLKGEVPTPADRDMVVKFLVDEQLPSHNVLNRIQCYTERPEYLAKLALWFTRESPFKDDIQELTLSQVPGKAQVVVTGTLRNFSGTHSGIIAVLEGTPLTTEGIIDRLQASCVWIPTTRRCIWRR